MIGIPYARANDDGSVTCPICGQHCWWWGSGKKTKPRTEDAITKGAARTYGMHYEEVHAATPLGVIK